MQKAKKKILSTRPVGEELINEAFCYNIIIDEISFIETREVMDKTMEQKIVDLSKEKINAVFTSMNAVEALRRFVSNESSWKIFCIGHTTKKLAIEIFGKENITATGSSAQNLAEEILKQIDVKKVHFFCGNKRRDELPLKLTQNKVEVDELVVYQTIETSQSISKDYDGILFFSPSAVKSFFSKNLPNEDGQLFAIGETTAKAIKHFSNKPVIVAEIPDKKNLVAQAIHHFSTSKIS